MVEAFRIRRCSTAAFRLETTPQGSGRAIALRSAVVDEGTKRLSVLVGDDLQGRGHRRMRSWCHPVTMRLRSAEHRRERRPRDHDARVLSCPRPSRRFARTAPGARSRIRIGARRHERDLRAVRSRVRLVLRAGPVVICSALRAVRIDRPDVAAVRVGRISRSRPGKAAFAGDVPSERRASAAHAMMAPRRLRSGSIYSVSAQKEGGTGLPPRAALQRATMLITKHFVFVHLQKTGGNFVKAVCRAAPAAGLARPERPRRPHVVPQDPRRALAPPGVLADPATRGTGTCPGTTSRS